jgi:hypothetical protein
MSRYDPEGDIRSLLLASNFALAAYFNQDAKAIDAMVAKADALEQQLGPDYDKVIKGLEMIGS